ncbi:hypothetical protein L2E82_45950 [Cichorium intybus]|uniref:Uncharacterized protein n=1 Tax=Cichorium intybus TaxID=13427 RepID=A0ACB8ZUX0_CICIN|nr:hypothetical protein L2E82_45950 [Cichorium intybus]
MDILKPLSIQNSQIFSGSSLPYINNSVKFYRSKGPPNFRRPFFKFRLHTTPVLLNSPLQSSRNFRVSAHFSRPAKRRRNHLREKLIEQQVRQNPSISHDLSSTLENPVRKIDDINDSLSNLGISNDDIDYSVSIPDKSKIPDSTDALKSNNALWNQLDSWANQYKADAEFWGIGSNPIFTILQDSNGKIEKVDVNEDEILRRNQIEPSIYNLKEVEHAKEVQDKISHAKFLAKEMEIGKTVLPLNSSVAKFVISDRKSGFRDTIQSLTSKPVFVGKFSKIGISMFCGFLVFLAVKGFFGKEKEDKEEYSSLEKEMLRRKIKSRTAKEKSIKGSVEVIQDSKKPEMVFTERPRVDKEELMNSIVKVQSLNDNSIIFNDKIQEIRAMARHAREIEKTDGNKSDGNEKEVIEPTFLDEPEKGNIVISGVPKLEVPTNNGSVAQGVDTEKVEKKSVSGNVKHVFEPTFLDEPEKGNIVISGVPKLEVPTNNGSVAQGVDTKKVEKKSVRILSSVKEAREYLQKKKLDKKEEGNIGNSDVLKIGEDEKEECVKGSKEKKELGRMDREKWMEDNFHEFKPIVEKIRGGFKENYMVAREKVKENVNVISELKMLENDENESEFEWMKDEKLREIVFQVRENELMGREPFYLMDNEDKALFFKGLEKRVEKENEKLRDLHEYVHSNIENLDYGADGISLYDPPEKIIPRWKGPPPSTTITQEFLDDYLDQRKALFSETLGNSNLVNINSQNPLQSTNEKAEKGTSGSVIEGSDGSIKPGKKSGKEFWQHTKKWSRGFIDSYNAENDPETKAVMKDIGKDLDRWITEKEIQDVAHIMDKVPEKGKRVISEKINKLKREMELFGPQAVVSKYSEYGDEEEEIDYYWWLDLPFLMCIELYIDGDEDERIGFYSLEMASDLELDPKPHHIIAFEDAGDCKNLCYILQAHMEMIGNGNAFVVPQLPKDTYREAKANGFNVTVIRKGEIKMDVDQTLEEVEEIIVEIGSKMYHDKIMKGRNVNVDSVMKGVFGLKKPTKRRRSRKKLKKPTK